jgi:hypothetical protein
MLKSFLIGFSISMLNAIAAFISIKIAVKKTEFGDFNKIVFGSMVIRYIIVAALVLLALLFLNLDKLVFGLTFMLTTFVLLIIEILYLNNRTNFVNL